MKILIFNTLYYPNQIGGAEKSVQLLAEGLLQKAKNPIIVCTSNRDYINYVNGVKVYYIKPANIYWPYHTKGKKNYKKPVWHFIDAYNPFNIKIKTIIDTEKPEIIHTNNLAGFSVSIWKIAKVKNIKIVHTLRDYYLLCPKSTMFRNNHNCINQCLSCKFYSIPKKKLSKYIDNVVGISKFILDRHIDMKYFTYAKKSIIFNSIDMFNNTVKNKSLGKNTKFGFVGLLSENKGIEFLLKNFKKINIDNTMLCIYGGGITSSYEKKLKEYYSSNKIIFKGFKNIEDIYKNIDILIIPSLWNEPFGRVILEANSYGIPVLATNMGGLPELVIDGQNGYVFNPVLVNDFKEKIKLILNMRQNNKFNFSSNRFDTDRIINSYLEIYKT